MRLDAFYELLARWNRKINLTSLDNPDEAIDRLLLEPIAASRYLAPGIRRLMDVGSGGGSPAIPLKLANPQVALTMVEVKTRKSAFLNEAVRHLELSDTRVETARVEELLTHSPLHEAFDAITVRAVRIDAKSLLTLQAFVAARGQILLFRGPSGPDTPSTIVPPLRWEGTYPLIDSSRSRLTVLSKLRIGTGSVSRGTIAETI